MIAKIQEKVTQPKRRRYGHLWRDQDSGRFVLDGWELHCGNVFEVLVDGAWHEVRIEHGDDWLLVGLPPGNSVEMEGLEARSCQ
jgi:Domain of unknown function (DUF5348)